MDWIKDYQHSIGLLVTGAIGSLLTLWSYLHSHNKRLGELTVGLQDNERRCADHKAQILRDFSRTNDDIDAISHRIEMVSEVHTKNHAEVMEKLGSISGEIKHLNHS